MNEAAANPTVPGFGGPKPNDEGWSRKKWFMVVVVIFVAHVAVIFAFGEKKQAAPRPVTNVPSLKLSGDSGELLALDDPTLFALPHLEGFAGSGWRNQHLGRFHRQDWTEQPRWLPLSADNLGATFSQFMQTNFISGRALDFKPEAVFSEPAPVEPAFTQDSTLQVEGELALRRRLDKVSLPSLQYGDVIKPSQVQVLVNAAGDVISTALLESSGFKDADDKALELARAARFTPSSKMSFGKLIFNWQTVPLATTNSPVSSS